MGIKKGLTLNQKLALMPASIPDCILDFLEDFNSSDPLASQKTLQVLKPDFFQKNETELRRQFTQMRELGDVEEVTGNTLSRQYPGGFMVKLAFERGVRGLGFIVSQGTGVTGVISVILVQEDGYSEDYLKERLTSFYKK